MNAPESAHSPLDCETVVRALWEYLDGEVDAGRLGDLEHHLASCDHCRAHSEFERRLLDEIAGIRRQISSPARVRSRVMAALRTAGFESG